LLPAGGLVTLDPTTATLLPLLSGFGYAVAAIILKRATA